MVKISLKIYESLRFRDVKFKILCLISEGYQGLVAMDLTKHRAGGFKNQSWSLYPSTMLRRIVEHQNLPDARGPAMV